jgi:hypothetical protein
MHSGFLVSRSIQMTEICDPASFDEERDCLLSLQLDCFALAFDLAIRVPMIIVLFP